MENFFDENEKALIWLDSLDGLEYKYKKAFLDECAAPGDFLYNARDYINVLGSEAVSRFEDRGIEEADELCRRLAEKGIAVAVYGSESYPERLYGVDNPPVMLYCKGNRALLNTENTLAVVGSRKTSPAVREITERIAEQLSEKYCVVTGLAEGADSAALKGAVKKGTAITVLAYGFDHVFPSSNRDLLHSVEECGLAVTEHNPAVAPRSYLFPARNRLIAGLGDGALVVSAAAKSGALITADYAEKYRKKLFAFPYSIGIKSGEGCNNLLRRGAYLTESAADIYRAFGESYEENAGLPEMDDREKTVYSLLADGELHIDKIIELSGLEFSALSPVLMMLEIKGLIKAGPGNVYSALI